MLYSQCFKHVLRCLTALNNVKESKSSIRINYDHYKTSSFNIENVFPEHTLNTCNNTEIASMQVKQVLIKKGILLRCPTCGWSWTYSGNRIYYAGCSNCHRSIHIRNNMVAGPPEKRPTTKSTQHPTRKELMTTS